MLEKRFIRWFAFTVILTFILTVSGPMPSQVSADTPVFPIFDGYPKQGCFGYVVGSTGMWYGRGTISVDVPGPVVDAWLIWEGVNDTDDPGNPDTTSLTVNGQSIVGQMTDHTRYSSIHADWYQWVANVGPTGYNLISPGSNTLFITEWWPLGEYKDGSHSQDPRRNGVALMVIYDRSPCNDPVEIVPYFGSDYIWWQGAPNLDGGPLTMNHVFSFDPSPNDREAHLVINFAGPSQYAAVTGICRETAVWAAVGHGTPPDHIAETGFPGTTGVNGGVKVGANLFNQSPPCEQTIAYPLLSYSGGYVDAEWATTDLVFEIPAGDEWLSVQLESVSEGNPPVRPGGESGAWTAGIFEIPLPPPDVTLTKTDGLDQAEPGQTITYTVNFQNAGPGLAQDVRITDTLPAYTSFVDCTTTVGSCSETDGVVTVDVGDMGPGDAGVLQVVVRLDPVFPAGTTTLVNRAVISTPTQGDDPTNNEATDSTDVHAVVELRLEKSAAPEPVEAGSVLTYTLTWFTGGNAFADDLTLVDTLPEHVTFVSASDGGTYDAGSRAVTWLLGDHVPGDGGTVTLVVAVDTPLPNGTVLHNVAHLSDASGVGADAEATSTVHSEHTLHVEKSGPAEVEAGGVMTYTITYRVEGNEPAPNARLTDLLPEYTEYVSGGTYDADANRVTWDLGTLNPPTEGTVTLVVRAVDRVLNNTLVTNMVTFEDGDPGTPAVQDTTSTRIHSAYLPGTIGDTVWHDVDGDGVRDPNEPGIGGVTVDLYEDVNVNGIVDAGDTFVARATTDIHGHYIFNNVIEGRYLVTVSDTAGALAGMTKTAGAAGVNDNSQADPYLVILGNGETNLTADFGYTTAGGVGGGGAVSIGDLVWRDMNGDGTYDAGAEAGIPGVTLLLTRDLNGNGVADPGEPTFGVLTTDATGHYLYADLPPDKYVVDVTDENHVLTFYTLTTGNDPMAVDVSGGTDFLDADFGYQPVGTGRIGDLVFYDKNDDGVRQAGEPGLANVRLSLYGPGADGVCGTGDDVLFAVAYTDGNGVYMFYGLPADTYCVRVDEDTVPVGMVLGTHFTNPYGPIVLADGATFLDADFGYTAATVEGTVFEDANGNGSQDAGEDGIAGAHVCLYTTASSTPLVCADTDAAGHYEFDQLAPGDYRVRLDSWPGGYELTTNQEISVTAPAGQVTRADFGLARPAVGVVKRFDVPIGEPVKVEVGDTVTFTVRVQNTGGVPLALVPLEDTYDSTYLRFVRAEPMPDTTADGRLVWNDLTAASDLAAGQEIVVRVVFEALAETDGTTNTATVTGAQSVGGQTLPDISSQVTFSIQPPTAVTMASIFVEFDEQGAVVLNWTTTAEFDNWGFNIYRAEVNDPDRAVKINPDLIPGQGQSVMGATYRYVDNTVESGKTYWYWVEDVDFDGHGTWHGPVEVYVPERLEPGDTGGLIYLPVIMH